MFFLGSGALFEVLIGALERSEQLVDINYKPAIKLIIRNRAKISSVEGIATRRDRANTALVLAPHKPLIGNNAKEYV